jgi:hypothetical protein
MERSNAYRASILSHAGAPHISARTRTLVPQPDDSSSITPLAPGALHSST